MNKDDEIDITKAVLANMPTDQLKKAKEFLDLLADYKKVVKLHGTYVEGVKEALQNTGNGRMYVTYDIDGTKTGRLSNSGVSIKVTSVNEKGKIKEEKKKLGVSFHTLPRTDEDSEDPFNIRDYIIAPEDYDFITVDGKAMELRVLAHVANEKKMIQAFLDGIDLHTYSASMTFKKKEENVTKQERQIAKEVSFLTVYGGTEHTLANKRNISVAQAKKIIDNWKDAFPGIPTYFELVRDYIKQHKFAKTIFGRYRNLPDIDSPIKKMQEAAFRQGLNFTVQSPAGDILLCGKIGTYNEIRRQKLRALIVGCVHDSMEIISHKSDTAKVLRIVHDQLVNYPYMKENFGITLKVPMEIEIEVGPSFGSGQKVHLT